MILSLFTLGLSLLLSTIAVFFVDTVEIVRVILQAWFFLTPIIYPISVVPERFLPLYRLNPMVLMLEIIRGPIYSGTLPSAQGIVAAILLAVISLVIGWWVFTGKSDEFAYRI
jgi:ABC-2 type transport system permease protein